ncbi:MAG: phosphoribosylpyrophosphate synthetase [Chitinophagales bacterium]|nr:phosphoribosylpyrophosphate synthetase [Bacteroidota bacterium]MCB9042593.1 phosphoribosylpyrophosphate synthetase [Chitinophagales bacterium]
MENYDTLSEAINALRKQGYVEDFNLQTDALVCRDTKMLHNEFTIDKYFRFEGNSNPDDSSILYAISSEKHQRKGILVNAYGVYAEDIT